MRRSLLYFITSMVAAAVAGMGIAGRRGAGVGVLVVIAAWYLIQAVIYSVEEGPR